MTRRPEDTEPLPPPPAKEEKDEPSIDIQPGYTPDIFKVRTAQTKGEMQAAYQARPHLPRSGEDTQKLEDRVLIEQTSNEGFSGAEIREMLKERDAQRARHDTTISVASKVPKQRGGLWVVGLGAVVVVILLIAFASSHTRTPEIPPATAASSAPIASAVASIDVPPIPMTAPTPPAPTTAETAVNMGATPVHTAKPPSTGVSSSPSASAHAATSASGRPDLAVTPF